ncbi:MAG: hypothetical protein U0586_08505 [Candidatus Brocadiaceae bacterium]
MTRTTHYMVHCTLSLCSVPVVVRCALLLRIETGHCDLVLSLRAKRSNLSLINRHYLW